MSSNHPAPANTLAIATPGTRAERLLRATADASTFALLVVAPLLMGGRHPVGRFVFALLICMLALTWIWSRYLERQQSWNVTGMEWLLIAACGVIAFQLIPLPHSWLAAVSPAVAERLPLWTSSGGVNMGMGTWSCVSLHPDATRSGLTLFAAYALLFLVTAQRTPDQRAVARTLRWVAAGAMLMALVGLLQFVAGNGKFLWVYAHPTRQAAGVVRGAFANQNHMAHMLALGIGPLIWWLSCLKSPASATPAGERRDKIRTFISGGQWPRAALGTGLGLVLLAGLLTCSRAGVAAILLATVIVAAVLVWTGMLKRRGWIVAGVVALLLAVALAFNGYDRLASRVATLVGAGSLGEVSAGREVIWSAVRRVVADFPVLGTGVGTHVDVYPIFMDQYNAVEFTHAESGYLQVLEELGVVGLSLLLVAIGVVGNWCRLALVYAPTRQIRLLSGAVTASLLVSALHSLVDFVWYIPACTTITVVLAACAWRLSRLSSSGESIYAGVRVPRSMFLAGSLGTSVMAMVIITLSLGPARAAQYWDQFARLTDPTILKESSTRELVDQEAVEANVEQMISCVEQVLRVNPRDARAHSRMAALCLQKFNIVQQRAENAMSLTEIRDAAIVSEFPSLVAQNQWLDRAVPENRQLLDTALSHARRAIKLSPLQGEPYVYLAQLGFLNGDGHRAKWAYLEQALRVRPHNDDVLMAAGSELALEGDVRQATVYWRRVFHRNPVYQDQIIAMFAPQVSADIFLKAFQPDAVAARSLFNHYRKIGFVPQANVAGRYYIAQLNTLAQQQAGGLNADQCWDAFAVQDYLGDDTAALASLRSAAEQAPNRYAVRQKLASSLLRQNQYAEAREHLQWCLRRKPHDPTLQRALQTATRLDATPLLR